MKKLLRAKMGDLVAGLLTMAIGGFILVESENYDLGTLKNMGPGYFPMLLGIAMVAMGLWLVVTAQADTTGTSSDPGPSLRGIACLAAAILAFALLIEAAGMIPAVGATVFLASRANKGMSLRGAMVLSIGAALASWLIFRVGLGLQIEAVSL